MAQDAASAGDVPEPADAGPAYGMTPAQMETLTDLLRTVAVHGDVMAVVEAHQLANGTLWQLAETICDAAADLDALLDRVHDQRLDGATHPRGRVGEERATYNAALAVAQTAPHVHGMLPTGGSSHRAGPRRGWI